MSVGGHICQTGWDRTVPIHLSAPTTVAVLIPNILEESKNIELFLIYKLVSVLLHGLYLLIIYEFLYYYLGISRLHTYLNNGRIGRRCLSLLFLF